MELTAGDPQSPGGLPLSGGGVARLACQSFWQLWRCQLLFGMFAGACIAFCVWTAWFPVIANTLRVLPDRITLRDGQLDWPVTEPRNLAENDFLGIAVQPGETEVAGQTADLQLVIRPRSMRWSSLLGRIELRYPTTVAAQSGRVVASAWWGAWSWVVLLGLILFAGLAVIASWWFLATLYLAPTRMLVALFGRLGNGALAWRLAAAALFAGSLVISASVVFYGLQMIRMPGLLVGYAIHFLVGWVWIIWGVLNLPKATKQAGPSPFAAESPRGKQHRSAGPNRSKNPFRES